MAKSVAKGKRGEIDACRTLSAWWEKDPAKLAVPANLLPFRRTPNSGADVDREGLAGDLIVPPDCNLCVEVKNREGWDFDGLFRPKWVVWDWWRQTITDARKVGRIPLLLFTRNLRPWYYFTYHELVKTDCESWVSYDAHPPLQLGLLDNLVKLNPLLFAKKPETQRMFP